MAKVELHPLSDYHLRTGRLDLDQSGAIALITIPQSGIVKKVTACVQVGQETEDCLIVFRVGGVNLKKNGGSAVMTIPFTGSSAGDVVAIEFDVNSSAVSEAEDGDGIAGRSVLEILSDAAGDSGFAAFDVTIAR